MEATEAKQATTETLEDHSPAPESSLDIQEGLKKLREEVDNLNLDLTVERARTWVKDHPVLATGAALGIGLVAAAIVISLLDEEEEATRTERISRQVRHQIEDASQSLQRQAAALRSDLGHRAEEVSERFIDSVEPLLHDERISELRSKGGKVSTSVMETIKAAAAAAMVQKVSDWIKRYTK
ncbi:MAG: hypothetical protein HKN43_07940 [Rhodothermales bacterium]|nr:hypothetical protein [Rhodothermales bacterium]